LCEQDKSEDIKRIIGELEDGSAEGLVDVRKFEQAFTSLLVRPPFLRTSSQPMRAVPWVSLTAFILPQTERDMGTEIERAFKLFDVEKRGMITLSSLRRVAQEIGEKLSEEDLQEMILLADRAKARSCKAVRSCVMRERLIGGFAHQSRSAECCTMTFTKS
jgi:hypothetical protein